MNLTAWDIIADICIDLRMVGMGGNPPDFVIASP